MSPDLDGILARARRAVLEAAPIAMRHFRTAGRQWEKSPGQIVTEADIAIDRRLRELLPQDDEGWLSEETRDDGSRLTAENAWVVDPIDGTRSFAEGVPEFTICVGYLHRGEPVVGLVMNPASDELFEAAAGRGATLNGLPLPRIADQVPERPRIGVSRTEVQRRPLRWLADAATFTTIGSLALKLAFVAAGRLDAYVSLRRANDWDIAAADLILRETGVALVDRQGVPVTYRGIEPSRTGIVAAPPRLQAQLVARIAERLPPPVAT